MPPLRRAYNANGGHWVEAKGAYSNSKCAEPTDRPDVASRLASIISSQRRGKGRPSPAHRHGRIDRRALARAGTGDPRVFFQPGAPSPTKLRLVVILDLSGSMDGREATNAAQMAWDLILAAERVTSVSLEVWSHTTGALESGETLSPGAVVTTDDFIMVNELWKPGTSRWQFHRNIHNVAFRGNEDGFALKVIADDVLRRLPAGERALFVMVSDGAPFYPGYAGRGTEDDFNEDDHKYAHMREVCRTIRRKGAAVMSVSVSQSLRRSTQDQMYGHESVVQFTDNTSMLTQAIAKVVGKALN